jgi:hypothetical protein
LGFIRRQFRQPPESEPGVKSRPETRPKLPVILIIRKNASSPIHKSRRQLRSFEKGAVGLGAELCQTVTEGVSSCRSQKRGGRVQPSERLTPVFPPTKKNRGGKETAEADTPAVLAIIGMPAKGKTFVSGEKVPAYG